MRRSRATAVSVLAAIAALAAGACGDSPSGVAAGSRLEIAFTGLRNLDPATEGSYQAWAYRGSVPHPLGRLVIPADGRVEVEVPEGGVERLVVTVEPPGDTDAVPSAQTLLGGELSGGRGELGVVDYVTRGLPLNPEPGHHSLFTSSNNVELGYPSYENAGLWMFSVEPQWNAHGTREVKMTPLQPGWVYEGWVVHRKGTPDEVWLPYGKFRPDEHQLLSSRDDDGSGPFSGDEDYRNGGIEDVPGQEWTTNPFGLRVPGDLPLPFALDSVDARTGEAVWTHVITIEPAFDEGEPTLSDRPFLLRPYSNPIGSGGPGAPREILYTGELPAATVRVLH